MPKVNLLLFSMLFSCAILAEEPDQGDSGEVLRRLIPNGTISRAESFESNGFKINVYQANGLNKRFETTQKYYSVARISGLNTPEFVIELNREANNSSGVAAFHPKSGEPVLSVSDSNGDGRFDLIRYSVVDEEGHSVTEITDYEMDGQPDLRISYRQNISEIWHDDAWYIIEKRENIRGIIVGGKFKELEMHKNRFYVK